MRARNNNLCIRLNDEELQKFMTAWQNSDISKAEFLMELLSLQESKTVKITEEFESPKEF